MTSRGSVSPASRTRIDVAPLTTWALVRISPSVEMITPVPSDWPPSMSALIVTMLGATWSTTPATSMRRSIASRGRGDVDRLVGRTGRWLVHPVGDPIAEEHASGARDERDHADGEDDERPTATSPRFGDPTGTGRPDGATVTTAVGENRAGENGPDGDARPGPSGSAAGARSGAGAGHFDGGDIGDMLTV